MSSIFMFIFKVTTAFVMLFPIILSLGFLSSDVGAFCHTMFVAVAICACASIISFFLANMTN